MTQRGDDNKINVRLEDGMRARLKADACANNRSLNAEVVARLSGSQISLRDWLAGQALAGMCAFHGTYGEGNDPWNNAERAYEQADAMLATREARQS